MYFWNVIKPSYKAAFHLFASAEMNQMLQAANDINY